MLDAFPWLLIPYLSDVKLVVFSLPDPYPLSPET